MYPCDKTSTLATEILTYRNHPLIFISFTFLSNLSRVIGFKSYQNDIYDYFFKKKSSSFLKEKQVHMHVLGCVMLSENCPTPILQPPYRVLVCSTSLLGIHCINQAGHINSDLPFSVSHVMGLKIHATTPDLLSLLTLMIKLMLLIKYLY